MSAPPASEILIADRMVLRAVRFRDERSRTPIPWEGSALDLIGPRHVPKAEKKSTPTFSPVEYEEGAHRGKRGVRHATALVLDFDHLTTERAEFVLRRLGASGWAHLACTTYSHLANGPDDHCLQVLVGVSRPILPYEYEPVWLAANGALGRLADANARDISRVWYVASCPPERLESGWVKVVDGRSLDVDRAIAASGIAPGQRKKRKGPNAQLIEGQRGAGLMSLGGSLRHKGAGRDELLAALHAANLHRCTPPPDESEVVGIVDSLLRYDPASPLLVLNLTAADNAERFRAHVGGRFGYVHAWASWLHFDGVRWQRDGSGAAVRAALDTLRTLASEAEKVPDQDHRGELMKHALESESSARLSAMLTLGQAILPVAPEALDRDTDLLNVENGTLDLRTDALGPHDHDDGITRLAPVTYNPAATCPLWEAFLHRAMDGNERLIAFLQRAVGYSLTGHTNEQVLLLLYGVGANGKSTFLKSLEAAHKPPPRGQPESLCRPSPCGCGRLQGACPHPWPASGQEPPATGPWNQGDCPVLIDNSGRVAGALEVAIGPPPIFVLIGDGSISAEGDRKDKQPTGCTRAGRVGAPPADEATGLFSLA